MSSAPCLHLSQSARRRKVAAAARVAASRHSSPSRAPSVTCGRARGRIYFISPRNAPGMSRMHLVLLKGIHLPVPTVHRRSPLRGAFLSARMRNRRISASGPVQSRVCGPHVCHPGDSGASGVPEGPAHVLGQASPKEEPRPMHARFDRAYLELERLGDLGIRETLDVAQEKRRAGVLRKLVDRAAEYPPELAFDRRVRQSPRPIHSVPHMLARVVERRGLVFPRHFVAPALPTPQLLIGGG